MRRKTLVLCRRRAGGHAPPLQRHKTRGSRNVNLVCALQGFVSQVRGRLAPASPLLRHQTTVLRWVSGESASVTQQTCLLCQTADISAVLHSRHVCVCCVTRQICQLRHTADTCVVSHSRHGCCGPRQTCVPCYTGNLPNKYLLFFGALQKAKPSRI